MASRSRPNFRTEGSPEFSTGDDLNLASSHLALICEEHLPPSESKPPLSDVEGGLKLSSRLSRVQTPAIIRLVFSRGTQTP
ncbi:MAG: hypothetical protein ACI87E_003668 [Mariniblastus sp.]|jgi:hypothetical protein